MSAAPSHTPQGFSRVIAGGLFALFFGSIIQALTVYQVITMTSGHFFMLVAWVAGTLIITTELFPLKPTRHKIASVLALGFVLLGVDLLCATYAKRREEKQAAVVAAAPTPTTPPPRTSPSTSPSSQTPEELPMSSPQPQPSVQTPGTPRVQTKNENARKLEPVSTLLRRARILYEAGRYRSARITCEEVLRLDRHNAEAKELKALIIEHERILKPR